jgi:hypothetical protein
MSQVPTPATSAKSGSRNVHWQARQGKLLTHTELYRLKSFQALLKNYSSLLSNVHIILDKYIYYQELVCFKNSVYKSQTRHSSYGEDFNAGLKMVLLLEMM